MTITPDERAYLRGMELLLSAVQQLSLARDFTQIQAIFRATARQLTGCDGATFVLRDNGQCYYADEDAIAPLWKGRRFPMSARVSGWTMLNRATAIIPDIYDDPRVPHEAYRSTFVKSLVMVPIRTADPIGAIGNYWAEHHVATEVEVRLLQALADSTSVAMENIRVYAELESRVRERTASLKALSDKVQQISITDELTGLYNRCGFYQLAEASIARASKDRTVSVLYVDIDGLKPVNDEYGHPAGDELIATIGRALRDVVRADDIVARVGGDEFCVLSVGKAETAVAMRDRFEERLTELNRAGRSSYPLRASCGIAADGTATVSLLRLVAAADDAMYQDKQRKLTV